MPWKRCYYCGGYSYSAATAYDHWTCPYCHKDLTGSPECERPLRVIAGNAGAAAAHNPHDTPPASNKGGPAPTAVRSGGRVVSMARRAPRPRRLRLI